MFKPVYYAVLVLVAGTATYAMDVDSVISAGQQAVAEGHAAAAASIYTRALKHDPDNPSLNAEFAYVLYLQGKYADAMVLLRDILEERSVFEPAYYYLGLINFKMEKYRDALNNFRLYQRIADRTLPRYAASHRYVAEGYRELLYREGLTRKELAVMLENYAVLIRNGTDPDVCAARQAFVDVVNRAKPRNHYGKWRLQKNVQQLREVVADTILVDSLGAGCAFIPTMASRKLQEDTYRQIRIAEKVKAPACTSPEIVCTEFAGVTEDFVIVEGELKRGSWREKWDIDRCGTIVSYSVEYVVNDGSRTYIFLNIAGEERNVIPGASNAGR